MNKNRILFLKNEVYVFFFIKLRYYLWYKYELEKIYEYLYMYVWCIIDRVDM